MPNGDWVGSPYARLYASFQDDYPEVYGDDHLYAWYCRLTPPAERAWPVRLTWPRRLPEDVQSALVASGCVEDHGDRYAIHGMDRLRAAQGARVEAARIGGQARAAQAVRGPDGTFRPADIQPDAGSDQRNAGSTLDDQPDAGRAGPTEHETPEMTLDTTLDTSAPNQPSSPEPSRAVPPRAAPSGPGVGTRTHAPAPAPETRAATAVADPRTVQGHPRYQAMAAEERDWEAWAESQAEPSAYPDARPSNQGRYGPANPDCRSPETLEHRRYWRWIGRDRGWVCLYCDRADARSFRERMDDASPF